MSRLSLSRVTAARIFKAPIIPDVTHPNSATEKGFSVGTNREGAEEWEGQVRFDGNVGHDLEPW
jgi:hypothetical protein